MKQKLYFNVLGFVILLIAVMVFTSTHVTKYILQKTYIVIKLTYRFTSNFF